MASKAHKLTVVTVSQELLGIVADLAWDATAKTLTLTAACSLPAGTAMTPALTAYGADPNHLIMTHGLSALSWAQPGEHMAGEQRQAGDGSMQMPWQRPDAASFQLCIEPPEEDECREMKLQLLAESALGTAHVLTATSSQVWPVIMLKLCCYFKLYRCHWWLNTACYSTQLLYLLRQITHPCKYCIQRLCILLQEKICMHRALYWAGLQPQKPA